MCEFCETNDANRLFRGLKVAKSGLNAGFCGWKRGLLCGESGVFEVGLFRFRL